MYLQVKVGKDSDGTAYYALLRTASESKQMQQISVYALDGKLNSLKEARQRAYSSTHCRQNHWS
jgi:chemotaxis methyl-accepting protein methylase